MNPTLEQLYRLRHALNVAVVHGEINVNDEVIEMVAQEIKDLEFELTKESDVLEFNNMHIKGSTFDKFFSKNPFKQE